jgi:hypothetical protein
MAAILVSGTKIFITWGEHDVAENIIHLVLARLPDAPPGLKGISLFLVPKFLVNDDGSLGKRNDLICASIEHKLGIHGSPTAVMSYGENEGAVGYLIGDENKGIGYMFTMMNHARVNVGLEGVGIAERAYQHALWYARERVQGKIIGDKSGEKKTILHHPDVRRMLMDVKSRTEAMRTLAYYAAANIDRAHAGDAAAQARVDLLTPVVKGWSTEQGVELSSTALQVFGGVGFVEETGAAQYYRDSRITTIYEGTTAIQANDLVGRKLAREKVPGAAMKTLIAEMSATAAEIAGNAQLATIAVNLKNGINSLSTAADWILANYDSAAGCRSCRFRAFPQADRHRRRRLADGQVGSDCRQAPCRRHDRRLLPPSWRRRPTSLPTRLPFAAAYAAEIESAVASRSSPCLKTCSDHDHAHRSRCDGIRCRDHRRRPVRAVGGDPHQATGRSRRQGSFRLPAGKGLGNRRPYPVRRRARTARTGRAFPRLAGTRRAAQHAGR